MFKPSGLEVLKFPCNLQVVYQPLPTAAVVADVWIQAGSSLEEEQTSGLAHLLEHMIFKGTPKLAPGMFDRFIENQGGFTNAATSHDYVHYFVVTAVSQFLPALSALGHLLLHASIPDAELEEERRVVLAEIHQGEDNPDYWGWEHFNQQLYPCHPYGRSILGAKDRVLRHSVADLQEFHRSYYQPHNMTIVVAGGIDRETCLGGIETAFAEFPALPSENAENASANQRRLSRLSTETIASPQGFQPNRRELSLPYLEQARLMLGWQAPPVTQFRDACGLQLLSIALAGGRSSRLVQELREQRGVVQEVWAELDLRKSAGRFTITSWLMEADLPLTEALILHQLQRLRQEPLAEWELKRSQQLLLNDLVFSTETPLQVTALYGYYSILQDPSLALRYPQQIQGLTAADLQEISQQYLTDQTYVATIVRPA